MEITSCEQYVLAELDYEQRRNERLQAENNRLAKRLDAMTKRAQSYYETIHREKTPIEALADETMRKAMMERFTYADVTSAKTSFPLTETKTFEQWCLEAVSRYGVPKTVSQEQIIEFLEDDLRAVYDKKVKEAQECTE